MRIERFATTSRHLEAIIICSYFILAALFYFPHMLGLRTFPHGDFTHHFLPFNLFQHQELLNGRLPLWNPYTYAGHPFLADVQAAVLYPISNLFHLITLAFSSSGARLYILQIEAIFHIALAGYFTYLLARDLTHSRFAAFLSGCTFAFSGYLTSYPPLQLAILRTAIWLPLLLWLLHRAMMKPKRWRWWLGTALGYATAFLAGHPQTFLHLTYTLAAWGFLLLFGYLAIERDYMALIKRWIGILCTLALALFLSLAQLLPSLEFTLLSVRANVAYDFVSGGSSLRDTWQLLMPGLFTQFSPIYIGIVGLGLAVCAFGLLDIRYWGRDTHTQSESPALSRHLPFFLLLTLLALLLSYGQNSFLYPLFYRFAPGWNLFRGQERVAYLVAFGLSILTGYGAAALQSMPAKRRRLLATLFATLVTAGVYAFGLFWQLGGHTAIGRWQFLGNAGVTLIFTAFFVVMLRLDGWSHRRSLWLTILLVGNLFWANFMTNIDLFGPYRKTIRSPELEALTQAVETAGVTTVGLPGRTYNEFRVYEDYGMSVALEDVWGSSPLRLARYAALFEEFPLDRMWRLTGVEHLLTWRKELFESSKLLGEFPQSEDITYLHRLDEPNPRAWLVNTIRFVEDDEAIQLLADHTFDLDTIGLLPPDTQDVTLDTQPVTPDTQPVTPRLTRITPTHLYVEIESKQGGLLIISENWIPGWQIHNFICEESETSCPTPQSPIPNPQSPIALRTNLTFIGVQIPGGSVQFDLVYWPNSVRYGLLLSGTTLILLALATWGRWLWRWTRRP